MKRLQASLRQSKVRGENLRKKPLSFWVLEEILSISAGEYLNPCESHKSSKILEDDRESSWVSDRERWSCRLQLGGVALCCWEPGGVASQCRAQPKSDGMRWLQLQVETEGDKQTFLCFYGLRWCRKDQRDALWVSPAVILLSRSCFWLKIRLAHVLSDEFKYEVKLFGRNKHNHT